MLYTKGRNLFVRSTMTEGKYLGGAGDEATDWSEWKYTNGCSDWIEVVPGETYTLTINTDGTGANLWNRCIFYDESRNMISQFSYDYNISVPRTVIKTVVAPENAAYARLSARHLVATDAYPAVATKIMFQYGSEATDWRPAPEDAQMFEGGVELYDPCP